MNYQNLDIKLRGLKSTIQQKLHATYWSYTEAIITPMDVGSEQTSEYQGMKRFWSFIKSRRKDDTCVASLKKHGRTTESPVGRANILNDQFEIVST